MVCFWFYIITCLCLHSPNNCWANTNQRSYDVVSPPHFYVGLLTVDIQYPNVSTINPSWCHSLCDSWSNDPLGCLIRGRTISVDFSREKHCSSKKGVQNGSLACRCGNLSAPASRWTFFAHGPTLRNLLDDLDQKKEVAKESSMSGLHVSQQCRQQWHMKNSLQPLHLCDVRWQVRCNWSFPPAAWRVILGVRQVIGWCRRLEDLTQQFNNCYVITSGLTFLWHHRDSPWDHHGKPPCDRALSVPTFWGPRCARRRSPAGWRRYKSPWGLDLRRSDSAVDRDGGVYDVVHLMMGIWDMEWPWGYTHGDMMGIYGDMGYGIWSDRVCDDFKRKLVDRTRLAVGFVVDMSSSVKSDLWRNSELFNFPRSYTGGSTGIPSFVMLGR